MRQRALVTSDDDDDDDEDVKQEVTGSIQKFVQSRHVQTLKYLQHVIDENRHLRLHIEHLKRRQNDPNPSPAVVDPIDPEDVPLDAIPVESESMHVVERIEQATNTEGEDFEVKYNELNEEFTNTKKEYALSRDEFQRELERVDQKCEKLEKEVKTLEFQFTTAQKRVKDREEEVRALSSSLTLQQATNEASVARCSEIEHRNRKLKQSLIESEQSRTHLEGELETLRDALLKTQQQLSQVEIDRDNYHKCLQTSESEVTLLKRRLEIESDKNKELTDENHQLKETVKLLEHQLKEKIAREEENNRAKQLNNNFKDYIQVKRALQACKLENEQLHAEMRKMQMKFLE